MTEQKTPEQSKHCPKCGTVMCQEFDYAPAPNGITLAVPNGKYSCYRCGAILEATEKL